MRQLFPQGPQELLDDAHMMAALAEWGLKSRITNMGCERLLASVKTAAPGRAPLAEHVCAGGFMKQLLTHHVLHGGSDPTVVSGHDLVQKGAPLRMAEKGAHNKHMCRPSLLYANDKLTAECRRSGRLSQQQRNAVLKGAMRDWHSQGPAGQAVYLARARAARAEANDRSSVEPSASADHVSRFCGLGSAEFPISLEATRAVFFECAGKTDTGNEWDIPGFTSHSKDLRKAGQDLMFVADQHTVPADAKYEYNDTCCAKHFGLCPKIDGPHFATRLRLSKALHGAVEEDCWYTISVGTVAASERHSHSFYVAYKRSCRPKVAVICNTVEDAAGKISLQVKGGAFAFASLAMLSKRIITPLTEAPAENSAVRVWLRRLQCEEAEGTSLLSMRITGHRDHVQVYACGKQFSQKCGAGSTAEEPTADERDRMFEEGAFCSPALQPSALGRREETQAADNTEGRDSSSSSEQESEPDPVEDIITDVGAIRACLSTQKATSRSAASSHTCAQRQVRGQAWGPFAIAEIFRAGESKGYGIICGLHRNAGDAASCRCKKALDFGKEGLSPEACIVRLKRWAVRGLAISKDNPVGRTAHLEIDARKECATGLSLQELDAERDRLYSLWPADRR